MRVGIYNRWLATIGGGEKHSLAIAEHLSRHHSVTVISHTPVGKDLIADRLNLDLSAVEFVTVPTRPALELAPITAEYDLFINASHMDFVPSRAPRGVMMVYFPIPAHLGRMARFRRRVGLALKDWLMVPHFEQGVFGIEFVGGLQLRRTGHSLKIKIASSRLGYCLRFDLASQDVAVRRAAVSLDGCLLEMVDLPADQSFTPCQVIVPGASRNPFHELAIRAEMEEGTGDSISPFKMALARFEIDHLRYRLYQLLFERWLKEWGLRLHGILPQTFLDSVDTYDAIWANSEFTRKWIKRYWDRPSFVLPPVVSVEDFRPGQKRNQILSVGRFFAGSHNKKHLVMIAAFKQMVDHGLTGWELHLAGGTTPGAAHDEYLQRVYAEARDYPIVIHTDVPFDELVKLYGESAIYWHASGFGEDEDREPIKLEHFGITTVEAMAAGCVPVVIGKGGQPEIVKHGRNGFLWQGTGELKALTRQLIADVSLRQRLASVAVNDSHRYDRAHFHVRLRQLLERIGGIDGKDAGRLALSDLS